MKKSSVNSVIAMATALSALALTYPASAANLGFVRNPNNSLAGDPFDAAWVARLGSNHTVTVISQATPASDSSLLSYDLFIVSQDVAGSTFLNGVGISQPKPMLFYEPAVYNSVFGAAAGGNVVSNLTILDSSHPLAAGLSGTVTIYNAANGNIPTFNPSAVSSGSQVVALNADNASQGGLVMLPAGAIGANGNTWSHVRIGLPCYDNWDPSLVTADGWRLLDNAVAYGLVAPVPEPNSLALLGLGMGMFLLRRLRR